MHQAVLPRSNLPTISFAHQSTLPVPLHGLNFSKISNQKFLSGTIFSELKKRPLDKKSVWPLHCFSHSPNSSSSHQHSFNRVDCYKLCGMENQILHLIESLKVAKYLHQGPSAEWSTTLDKGENVPNSAFDQRKEQDLPQSGITSTIPED